MSSKPEAIIADLPSPSYQVTEALSKLHFAAHILYILSDIVARNSCRFDLIKSKPVIYSRAVNAFHGYPPKTGKCS